MQMKNQLAYWQEQNMSLYCFPNEKDDSDIKFSGTSDQILGSIYKKPYPYMFLFWVNDFLRRRKPCFIILYRCKFQNTYWESVQAVHNY